MGLPLELLPYAENFYRRFPEEFVALGMPVLEEIFDLRLNGTWSRSIVESPLEKTVEITIRRWQMPATMMPKSGHQNQAWGSLIGAHYQPQTLGIYPPQQAVCSAMGVQHQQQTFGMYPPQQVPGVTGFPGCTPPAPYVNSRGPTQAWSQPSCCGASSSACDDQSTARLVRLESALSALKPQIEALLTSQAKVQAQASVPFQTVAAPAHAAVPQRPATSSTSEQASAQQTSAAQACAPQVNALPSSVPQASLPQTVVPQGHAQQAQSRAASSSVVQQVTSSQAELHAEEKELRTRRNMLQLQIQTTPKEKLLEKKIAPSGIAKLEEQDAAPQPVRPMKEEITEKSPKANSERQRPRVNAVRVAPSADDPVSPRSPGRFTPWS